jgi:predicted dehydrogenase
MTDLATRKIRWGILATGRIAHAFVGGLQAIPDAEIAAVGSRTQAAAEEFGAKYNIPRRHASYEALARDPDVDIIYISTPHPMHAENMVLCLENGKHVICEKPFTINARQAEQAIQKAREKGLFLMDAMWTRFLPAHVRARQIVESGQIGDPWMIAADFGFRVPFDPKSRLFAPELGGGALLDVGVYVITFASSFFGMADRVTAQARRGATGVDEQTIMQLAYPGGQYAALSCAVRLRTPQEAVIAGTEGYLTLPSQWYKTQKLRLSLVDQPEQVIEVPFGVGNGYNFQAEEAMRCIRAGQTESRVMPLDETLANMRIMDAIRSQIGVKYPGE